MDELANDMFDYVQNQGGSVLWSELVEAMPPLKRAQIPRAFESLRKNKLLRRELSFNPTTGLSPLTVKVV